MIKWEKMGAGIYRLLGETDKGEVCCAWVERGVSKNPPSWYFNCWVGFDTENTIYGGDVWFKDCKEKARQALNNLIKDMENKDK